MHNMMRLLAVDLLISGMKEDRTTPWPIPPYIIGVHIINFLQCGVPDARGQISRCYHIMHVDDMHQGRLLESYPVSGKHSSTRNAGFKTLDHACSQ